MRASLRKGASLGFVLCCVVSCRFGGPSADPTQWIELKSDAGAAGAKAGSGSSGTSGAAANGGAAGALSTRDGSVGSDAQTEPLDDAGEGGPACVPPSAPPAVCDPLKNSGCGVGTHCDVDLAALVLAGRCTFDAPVDGGACLDTGVTTSCGAKQTCNAGSCRTVCLCNSDCATNECCSEALGTQGWKLCAPCP